MPQPSTLWVRVRRAFLLHGKAQPPDAVLQLPYALACEVIASNKAERCEPPAPAAPNSNATQTITPPKPAARKE